MARAQAVRSMGKRAEKFIWEKKALGMGLPRITTELNKHFKTNISQTAVYNYMQNNSGVENIQKQIGFDNAKDLRAEQIKSILNIDEQLSHTNSKLTDALDSIDMSELDSKMISALVSVAAELRKQFEFHKRYVEQIVGAPDKFTMNVNYSEAALLVGEQLEELEREGFIKILKPFGKVKPSIDAEFEVKNQKD